MKINGPINVARLEGTLFGIKKVIYVFMDYHLPVHLQTQCEGNEKAMDVRYYISESLKETTKPIDLFVEVFPSSINVPERVERGRYIDEVIRYFKQHAKKVSFVNDKKSEQSINRINGAKQLTSLIRYHYIDIRDALESLIYKYISRLMQMAGEGICSHMIYNSGTIESLLVESHEFYSILHAITFDEKSHDVIGKKEKVSSQYILILKYIKKILFKYQHPENKKTILLYLTEYIKPRFDKIFEIYDKLFKLLDVMKTFDLDPTTLKINDKASSHTYGIITGAVDSSFYEFDKLIRSLDVESLYLFSRYVDAFFLRRFLDKDYVDTAITYTGISHSTVYVQMLVRNLGFKITHISTNPIGSGSGDINKLNLAVQNTKTLFDAETLMYPTKLLQCSSLDNFPPNFD